MEKKIPKNQKNHRKSYRWNNIAAIKRSLGNILNGYIAGEVESEVLRNVVYASNCLINACKTINEEEVQELKDLIHELEKKAKEDE